jgi:signal transduction histidine kinase/ligand-binding sensor domain-containing protein
MTKKTTRFCGALTASLLLAAPASSERLIVRSYGVTDGLASDRVGCVVPDQDGFLWLCTNAGLSRVSGSRFVSFGTAAGLPDPAVNHFLQRSSGERWVATNGGGVARLEVGPADASGHVFTSFPVGTTPRSMRVNLLFETKEGILLAGTDGGLFRARSGDQEPRFEPVLLDLHGFPDSGLQVWAMAEDEEGRLWVGSSAGLVHLDDWRVRRHVPVAFAQGTDHVFAVFPDGEGRLWLGHDGGLVVWRPGVRGEGGEGEGPLAGGGGIGAGAGSCVVPGAPGLPLEARLPAAPGEACRWAVGGPEPGLSTVRSFEPTADGWIWIASLAGLVAFDGTRFRSFDTAHGLPTGTLLSVTADAAGDLWLGSFTGVHRVHRRGFSHFTTRDGLVDPMLRTILSGPDGEVYVVSATNVIHRFDGEGWAAVRPALPAFAGEVGRSTYGAALLDRTGAWWVGTGGGLLRFPSVPRLEGLAGLQPAAHYTTEHGLAGDDIWHLYEDARGDIWIATRVPGPEPLTRWDRGTGGFHRYGSARGLPAERAVRAFVEDPAGRLWVSLWDGGIARLDGDRFRYFAPHEDVPGGHLYQLLFDARGWLWVAGRETFFSRNPGAPDPTFEAFRTTDGQTISTLGLALDDEGWLYAGTSLGLVRLAAPEGYVQQLGSGAPFTGYLPPFHRDRVGGLWFLTQDGVLRYEPQAEERRGPPVVRVEGVRLAGVPLPMPPLGTTEVGPLALGSGQRQVQIDFFATAVDLDENLLFQVRLDPVDEGWSAPTPHTTALYAGLGAGRYRFRVRAVTADGRVSAEPAVVAFVLPPPVWARGWFLGALAVLLIALLATAHRIRVTRLLEMERLRTRIAADLHDDLGASLARVSLLTEATRRKLEESPQAAEEMLREIGETSRELVATAGDIAFSIDPGRGGLDELGARLRRFTEELLADTGIRWELTLTGHAGGVLLSSRQRRHTLAIVKEALHNAVRHGRPGRIDVRLEAREGMLRARIEDDGRGLDAGRALDGGHRAGGPPHEGQGLRNMRARAAELGGRFDVASRPAGGTRVLLEFPLEPSPAR